MSAFKKLSLEDSSPSHKKHSYDLWRVVGATAQSLRYASPESKRQKHIQSRNLGIAYIHYESGANAIAKKSLKVCYSSN
jgi:hypothetical protein